MKKLMFFFCLFFIASTSFSQLLDENFDYPAGDSLQQHGWIPFSGTDLGLFVTSPGLTFPGYPLSGIGNATTLTMPFVSAQDSYKQLSYKDSTGSIYASFMVNVDTATASGNYFISYLPDGSTSNYYGRVYARLDSNGFIAFGISKSSTSSILETYTNPVYSRGTTYLLVLKYTFNSGTSDDDEVSLFVFNSAAPLVEPAPTVGPITTTQFDAFNIGRIALRQGNSGLARTPTVTVDGIRVTRSWMPPVWTFKLAIQGLYNAVSGMMNLTDTVNIYVRNNTFPYALVDSAVSTIDSVSLTGSYAFNNTPNGNYYFEVKYRNVPYRNGISTWSKSGGETITRGTDGSYDFTTAASQAFGNNLFLKGSIYTIYNGDVTQEGTIDLSDLIPTQNASTTFTSGYLNTDTNGDNQVTLTDVLNIYNNSSNFVHEIAP